VSHGLVMSATEVLNAGVHGFASELVVEVTCRDEDGHLVVYSYQFDERADGRVEPKQEVPGWLSDVVDETLAEEGYSYEAPAPSD
jgi:hypothetical protein